MHHSALEQILIRIKGDPPQRERWTGPLKVHCRFSLYGLADTRLFQTKFGLKVWVRPAIRIAPLQKSLGQVIFSGANCGGETELSHRCTEGLCIILSREGITKRCTNHQRRHEAGGWMHWPWDERNMVKAWKKVFCLGYASCLWCKYYLTLTHCEGCFFEDLDVYSTNHNSAHVDYNWKDDGDLLTGAITPGANKFMKTVPYGESKERHLELLVDYQNQVRVGLAIAPQDNLSESSCDC